MIYIIGENKISEWISKNETNPNPVLNFPWLIEVYNKNFALKKSFFIGSGDTTITRLSFTIKENGPQNASMDVNYFDVFLEYNDFVKVSYFGKALYLGYVTEIPENKGGSIKINSLINRLNEILQNASYTDQTKKEIIEDVISSNFDQTFINYNSALVSLSETELYSPNYQSIKLKTILDDWAKSEEGTFWGYNADGFLYVNVREESQTKEIYPGMYESIKYKLDYKKIKYTRIALYRTVEDGEGNKREIYVGEIPDGSIDFPYFSVEDIIGQKWQKQVAPQDLSEASAKRWAYGKIFAQILPTDQLTVKGLSMDMLLTQGQKVRVFTEPDLFFREEISTESLDNWSGASLSGDSYNGNFSISVNGTATYFPDGLMIYEHIHNMIFYAKSSIFGNKGNIDGIASIEPFILTTEAGEIITTEAEEIVTSERFGTVVFFDVLLNIPDAWNYIDIPINQKIIKKINFNLIDTKIDFIHFFAIMNKVYDLNVKEMSFNIAEGRIDLYDVILGSYDMDINDVTMQNETEIERRST